MSKPLSKWSKDWSSKQKLQYIWDYYKLPLFAAVILLYVLGSLFYGRLTRKEIVLYTALINVEPSSALVQQLTDHYLADEISGDSAATSRASRQEVYLYQNLFLSAADNADPQYTAASRMKILAAIDAEELDVIVTSREVMDAFAEKEYLYDLTELVDADVRSNQSTLYRYDSASSDRILGLHISEDSILEPSRYDQDLYVGILVNTPRIEQASAYLKYLY
ncbi:MAG: hypothetical protein Q4B22_04765 [Eubacteriales bacterium]|nr:hypothetical protein [Eubacteriales bacterium]